MNPGFQGANVVRIAEGTTSCCRPSPAIGFSEAAFHDVLMSDTPMPTPTTGHVHGEVSAGGFPPPPALPRCQAVVLACIDFRFVEPLYAWLRSHGLAGDFDLVCWPGGAVALGTADRAPLLDAVALACDLHQPTELLLVVHHDCGRLGGSASFPGRYAETATLNTALEMAGEVAANRFPDLVIHTLRLDLDGRPSFLDSLREAWPASAHTSP